jgi:hypothetical protein
VTPFLGFFRDQLAEIGRRADHRCAAQLGKPRVELRVGETRVNGLVELVDDLRRLRERSIADRCRGFWS